ncbi:hypothetical protein VNI00_015938 [Paramarasmius palmivorus]|uniref:MYND-type domain-containing protein n=1 Tax=Paramarasmius palmivorus TaxID=297713 RepID=A0AAW0BHY5_9AGAR
MSSADQTNNAPLATILDQLSDTPPRQLDLAHPARNVIQAIEALRSFSIRIDVSGKPFDWHDDIVINEIQTRWNTLWAWCRAIFRESATLLVTNYTIDLSFVDKALDAVFRVVYTLCREDTVRDALMLAPTSFTASMLNSERTFLSSLGDSLLFVGRQYSQTFILGVRTVFEMGRDTDTANASIIFAFVQQDPRIHSEIIIARMRDVLTLRPTDADNILLLRSLINIVYITCSVGGTGTAFRDAYLQWGTPRLLMQCMRHLSAHTTIDRVTQIASQQFITRSNLPHSVCRAVAEMAGLLLAFLLHAPNLRFQMIEDDMFAVILESLTIVNNPSTFPPKLRHSLESRLQMLWKTVLKNYVVKCTMQTIIRAVSRIIKRGLEDELQTLCVASGPLWALWQDAKKIRESSTIIRGIWRKKVRETCGNCGSQFHENINQSDEDSGDEHATQPGEDTLPPIVTTGICTRCKEIHYCSKRCQREHWEAEHRTHCKRADSIFNNRLIDLRFCQAALEHDTAVTFESVAATQDANDGTGDSFGSMVIDYRCYPPSVVRSPNGSGVQGVVQHGEDTITFTFTPPPDL